MKQYLIGEASELTGLSRDTLRFYEKKGLIRSERKENGYRVYSEEELSALVSILYRRRMNYSLKGIGSNLMEEEQQLSGMKELTEKALLEEKAELRKHALSIKRLHLTMRDISSIEKDLGRYRILEFPEILLLGTYGSYMDTTFSWFRLSSERDGLDMSYLLSRYEACGRELQYRDTSLIFYKDTDEELEAYLKGCGNKLHGMSGRKCLFTVADISCREAELDTVQKLSVEGKGRGLSLSSEVYTVNLIDSMKEGQRISYREIYIPII